MTLSDIGRTNLGFDLESTDGAAAAPTRPEGVCFTIGDSPVLPRRGDDTVESAFDGVVEKTQVFCFHR